MISVASLIFLQVMEIIETGKLKRIEVDNTEEVRAINLFYNIYGVGMSYQISMHPCVDTPQDRILHLSGIIPDAEYWRTLGKEKVILSLRQHKK